MIELSISDYVYNKLKGKQLQGGILPRASIVDIWEAQGTYLLFAVSSPLPDGNSIYEIAVLKETANNSLVSTADFIVFGWSLARCPC